MDHYIDIRVRPDPELATPHVLNALAGKLHLALAGLKSEHIGISFPRFRADRPTLGDTLRLHGDRQSLEQLMTRQWLAGINDHVRLGELLPVPATAKYRVVVRKQTCSSAERIRRRQMKRHGWTDEEAKQRIPDSIEKRLSLPFLNLRSQSTGQPYRLFIDHLPCQDTPAPGVFNTYGLSAAATVPWF